MSETKPEPTPEQIASTIGAQVVIDPASAVAQGAKGVFPTIAENTDHRDAGYIEMGLNPADPSGEKTDPAPAPAPEAAPQAARSGPPSARSSGTSREA